MGTTLTPPSGFVDLSTRRFGDTETTGAGFEAPPTNDDGTLDETALTQYLAGQLGLQIGADGKVVDTVSDLSLNLKGILGTDGTKPTDYTGSVGTLDNPNVESVTFGTEEQEGADSFQAQVATAFDEVFVTGTDAEGNKVYKDLSEVNADDLVAVFQKLGITDPANDPRAAEALLEVAKNIKKSALAEQTVKLNEKIEKAQEAEAKGDYAKAMTYVGAAVMVACACVLAAVTFGAGAALIALAVIVAVAIVAGVVTEATGGSFEQGFLMGATIAAAVVMAVCTLGAAGWLGAGLAGLAAGASSTAIAAVTVGGALLSAALQVTTAVAKKEAADAAAEASLLGLEADKLQVMAEERQKEIEALQTLIRTIMESKSAVIDAVLKMLNNKGATNEKILTIGAGRA